jgi:hypothetical protein
MTRQLQWKLADELLFSALNATEQPTLYPVSELRTDENVPPDAFCSAVRYNNDVAHDFETSGYPDPVDGVSQLEFSVPIPGFGDYGARIGDNHWADPHYEVSSFGSEGPEAVYAPSVNTVASLYKVLIR